MSRPVTFGIVGGYGATGRIVASELRRSGDGEILIGGRDLAKAQALAAELDSRTSAAQLDILDAHSLDDFCRRCSIIVNCAGPVIMLQDRVAQAALRQRSHYIDAAGMSFVKERMLPHIREIENLGLSFVVSAGWMPDISELLPAYAHAQARATMDSIESLTVYFADCGEWSTNALRDGAWFIHKAGLRNAGYFRKGEWTRVKTSQAFRRVDLGHPIGAGRFVTYSTPELRELGRQLNDCDVSTYTHLSGFRTVLATTLMALIPVPEGLGVRLVRNVFRRNRLSGADKVEGFVAAHIVGRSQGRRLAFTAQIVYRDRRDYWIHGVAMATVARTFPTVESSGLAFISWPTPPIRLP
jgi:saccharopine dehydrogenase-like NADP-dependent oxidoreductase